MCHERKCAMKIMFSHVFLFTNDFLSIDDVGVARGSVFQEIRPGAGFETGAISVKKSWVGYRSKIPRFNFSGT